MTNDDATPLVRYDVTVRGADGSVTLENDDTCIEIDGIDRATVSAFIVGMDGVTPLGEIARRCGLRTRDATSIADALAGAGMAREPQRPDSLIDPGEFAALARALYPVWKQHLFRQELWRNLVDGSATFTQFSGWLLENYHFIEGVNDRLGSATAYCSSAEARRAFAQHYAEEYDHGGFFLTALRKIGIAQEEVDRSVPLPTTRAILNHMRRAARTDSLQYVACSSFLESTGDDRAGGRAFFAALAERYTANSPHVLAPLVAHLELDEQYGHNGILERMAPLLTPITAARAGTALEAARALVELLELWSEEIGLHYSEAGGRYRTRSGNKNLLSSGTECRSGEGEFVVETDEHTLSFDRSSAEVLERCARSLDGPHDLANIAAAAKCDARELAAIVDILREHDALLDLSRASDAPDVPQFIEAFGMECRFWSREILAQPFWKRLLAGDLAPTTIFGWGIEFHHYVDAANEYMAAAVANCHIGYNVRMLLGQHYVEEAQHGAIFLRGLEQCGFPARSVAEAPPLPATAALTNFLFELACVDTLAIQSVFNLLQADRDELTRERIDAFYSELARLYPFAAPMFDAFRKHALIDVEHRHNETVFDRICAVPGLIAGDTPRRCVAAVRRMAELFILFFENIEHHYGAPDAIVPRRPFDMRAYQ